MVKSLSRFFDAFHYSLISGFGDILAVKVTLKTRSLL